MANLVGERELRHLRRHPGVVVDEGDDAGVQRSLGRVVDAVDVLRVPLVRLADAARSPYKKATELKL